MSSTLAFVASAAAIVVRLALLVRLHLTGARHPIREAVSDYGVGPTRRLFEAMGLAATAGWWLLALGVWLGYPHWSDRGMASVLLAVIGLTTLLIRFVPTDLEGERLTPRGAIHYGLAIVQFALAYDLMGNVTRLRGDALSHVLHPIALVSLVGLCVCLLPRLRRYFGLFERVFLVTVAVFYLAFAVASALHAA